MKEFGPNGVVIGDIDPPPPEANTNPTPQRPLLAIALGGPLAVILVSLIGGLWFIMLGLLGDIDSAAASTTPYLLALKLVLTFCTLNVVLFFIIVPVTWAVTGLMMLALGAHKKNYSLRFYRLIGAILVMLAIAIATLPIIHADHSNHLGAGHVVLGTLLGAALVGIPAGALLTATMRRILYWKKPNPV